jgi:integrase
LNGEEGSVFDVSTASLDALFRKAKARALIEDLHFHDTRREALTRMSKIFDVMELARISGHRDLRVLQNVYYAPSVKDLAAKLD